MKPSFIIVWVMLFFLALFSSACAAFPGADSTQGPEEIIVTAPADTAALPSIVDILTDNSEYALFTSSLTNMNLLNSLQGDGPFTVLAVSNTTLARLGLVPSQIDSSVLQSILRYHIIAGKLTVTELAAQSPVKTLEGSTLFLEQSGEGLLLDGYGRVESADIEASNGMVHVVDALLLPPETGSVKSIWGTLTADGRFSELVRIFQHSEAMYPLRFQIIDAVLAPTDEAFAQLSAETRGFLEGQVTDETLANYYLLAPDGWPMGQPLTTADMLEMQEVRTRVGSISNTGIFNYEVLTITADDDGILINDARVIEPDIAATNGVIHVLDTFLLPQSLMEHIPDS